MNPRTTTIARVCLLGVVSLVMCGTAWGQALEESADDECQSAQDVTVFATPFTISGNLETPPATPDIDFFLVATVPNSAIVVEMHGAQSGGGSLADPYLGVFDADCNLIAANDDYFSLDSRLRFDVPDSGRFVLAATSCCDASFEGTGGSAGSYLLTIGPPPPAIDSIGVRVVDALTGSPVRGDAPPFSTVWLSACEESNCNRTVMQLNPNSEGRVRFLTDFNGERLPAGHYRVTATAEGYRENASEQFEVTTDEAFELGDIAIEPPPIAFALNEDCAPLLPQGGECLYTVHVSNNTDMPLQGGAWSIVDAFGLGSTLDFTRFEAEAVAVDAGGRSKSAAQRLALGPYERADFGFRFEVPGFVRDGAVFCAELFIGLEPSPLVNTTRSGQLFCLEKGDVSYRLLTEAETRKRFATLDESVR